MYMYIAQGLGQITAWNKILIVIKMCYYKFQPFVFNEFSTFSPYACQTYGDANLTLPLKKKGIII